MGTWGTRISIVVKGSTKNRMIRTMHRRLKVVRLFLLPRGFRRPTHLTKVVCSIEKVGEEDLRGRSLNECRRGPAGNLFAVGGRVACLR